MPEFDKDVFELMIEKVIIGEKGSNEETNPRVITFILKSGNKIKCENDEKEDKNQQSSYEVSQNYLQPVCEPRGSLCVARVGKLPVIAEFVGFQYIVMFQKKGESRLEKVQKPKINVKVVLDMKCGNI